MNPHDILTQLPPYIIKAARVSAIIVSERPRASNEMAQYEHGTRNIYVLPNLQPEMLKKAMYHEIAHALDDNFGVGHYFGESPAWATLSKQLNPEYPTIEMFAEHMGQHLQDQVGHRKAMPTIARYLDYALAYLQQQFK